MVHMSSVRELVMNKASWGKPRKYPEILLPGSRPDFLFSQVGPPEINVDTGPIPLCASGYIQ